MEFFNQAFSQSFNLIIGLDNDFLEIFTLSIYVSLTALLISCFIGFPIGAILLKNKIAKCITPGSHGSTFGGNQLACAVSLAVMKEISKKKLLNNVLNLGIFLEKKINKILSHNTSVITEVFGKGLMLGIKCSVANSDLAKILREKGVLVVPASNNVIRLLPPLNITKKEAQKAIDIINEAVNDLK